MSVTVTHSTVATQPDESGAEVNKAEWNAAHTVAGLGTAAEAATTDFDATGTATAAIVAHEAASDPHPQYLTPAEGNAAYEVVGAVATHVALADPHTQYQKESEKAAALGYAGLDAGTKVPTAQLGSGVADATTYLRGDQTYSTVTATPPDIAISLLAPSVDETITAGYSAVVVRKFTIASGKKLIIGSGARFRIL
jgi:hypothetical protein